jgi:hypothetical protein
MATSRSPRTTVIPWPSGIEPTFATGLKSAAESAERGSGVGEDKVGDWLEFSLQARLWHRLPAVPRSSTVGLPKHRLRRDQGDRRSWTVTRSGDRATTEVGMANATVSRSLYSLMTTSGQGQTVLSLAGTDRL